MFIHIYEYIYGERELCIPISDIDIDTDIDIDMDSGEGWPSIYLCTEGWQPISPFWERSIYLSI